jgi:N6-L-threonylcarbamoyladenine synthase/protein kinase Bud32
MVKDFGIPAPYIFDVDLDSKRITMSYINGKLAKDVIEDNLDIAYKIGEIVGKLHKNDVIHNDLTTSNFLYDRELYIIDFGLGKISNLDEDKAVDLIVFKKAVLSTHNEKFEEIWERFLEGYKSVYDRWEIILDLMKEVERRARYVE